MNERFIMRALCREPRIVESTFFDREVRTPMNCLTRAICAIERR
jgi:hypothetical protein